MRPIYSVFFWTLIIFLNGCAHTEKTTVLSPQESSLENLVVKKVTHSSSSSDSDYLVGLMFLQEGKTDEARHYFKLAVGKNPHPLIMKKYALTLLKAGEIAEAQKLFEMIYQLDQKSDPQVGMVLAGLYLGQNKTHQALELYRELHKRFPQLAETCLQLAKAWADMQDWEASIGQYETCQKKYPQNAVFSFNLGRLYVERGDLKKAFVAFLSAHERQPYQSQTTAALGVMYEQFEQLEKAEKLYREHLEKNKEDVFILQRMIQVLFQQEKFSDSVTYLERFVDLEPDDLSMRLKLGVMYLEEKNYEKARAVFREMLSVTPQSDKLFFYLGVVEQEQKNWEPALSYFTKIETNSQLYPEASYQILRILSELALNEAPQRAPEFLQILETKKRELPQLKIELGVMQANYFEAIEKNLDALEVMKQVITEKEITIQHQYYLASLYEKNKNYVEAESIVHEILKKDPKNAHAWNFLGYSLLERVDTFTDSKHEVENKLTDAWAYLEKALKLAPDDGFIRDSVGWYYYKRQQPLKALHHLSLAFEKNPEDLVIAKHLGLVYRELKQFTKAKFYLDHAFKLAKLKSEKKDLTSLIELVEKDRRPASDSSLERLEAFEDSHRNP